MSERARAVWTEGEARPRCSCHGEPMKKTGRQFNCVIKLRVTRARAKARYRAGKGRETEAAWRASESGRQSQRAAKARYRASAKGKEATRRYNAAYRASPHGAEVMARAEARRVRMWAGGVQFHIGMAPTPEDAQRIREKIKKEAPRGAL